MVVVEDVDHSGVLTHPPDPALTGAAAAGGAGRGGLRMVRAWGRLPTSDAVTPGDVDGVDAEITQRQRQR
jgi:hypothetical protein